MHLFRTSAPYPASGLLHCLSASLTCSSSFYAAPKSPSYFSSFSPSAASNPSEPRKSAPSENSSGNSEGRVSYDTRSSSSTLIQPSLLSPLIPDDASKPIRRPIDRLDISAETTYVSQSPAVGRNGRRYTKNMSDYGSNPPHGRGKNITRSWTPDGGDSWRSNAGKKGLQRRQAENTSQRMSFLLSLHVFREFPSLVFGNERCTGYSLSGLYLNLLVINSITSKLFWVPGDPAHLLIFCLIDR